MVATCSFMMEFMTRRSRQVYHEIHHCHRCHKSIVTSPTISLAQLITYQSVLCVIRSNKSPNMQLSMCAVAFQLSHCVTVQPAI